MPRSSERKPKKPDSRLPRWTRGLMVAAGVVAYVAVGEILQGVRFEADLENLWRSPSDFFGNGAETWAPYVLLLVPAVLGALWARETLQLVFKGLRKGDPPLTIAKDVALHALGFVILILVGLTSSSKRSHF